MTTDHNTRAPGEGNDERSRIAAELRALGEPEFDPVLEAGPFGAWAGDAAVRTAFVLAHPPVLHADGFLRGGLGDVDALGELERHRVWRKVVARSGAAAHPVPSPPTWRATWVAIATAAGLALVPMLSSHRGLQPSTPASRATTAALGVQAREALGGVPGAQDGALAGRIAAEYSSRLASGSASGRGAAVGPGDARGPAVEGER